MDRIRNRDLIQQILSCHGRLSDANEQTSENTLDAVLNGHNIGRATLEHRYI
jgi:hypothetical protein